ncbi:hypothetical protein Tsubulata_028813 [Turnera subulata]|uniref:NAC domain-containing protein n=1 Tax=Turnera subulata TaxID=218843 RepID=A0A9Q0IZ25_9ROSI|nr:hypothetical protein Tsubulata_028813 [Turnera subulata]
MTNTKSQEPGEEVGRGFRPTDQELISYYLELKTQGRDDEVSRILEVEFYKFEPYDLPKFYETKTSNQEWYFFCCPQRKYRNSDLISRTTQEGHWKSTGKDRKIMNDCEEMIGRKKILVYIPHSPYNEFRWIIHEYRLANQDNIVLCKLMKKPYKNAKKGQKISSKKKGQKEATMSRNDGGEQNFDINSDIRQHRIMDKPEVTTDKESGLSTSRALCDHNRKSDKVTDDHLVCQRYYIPTSYEPDKVSSNMISDFDFQNQYPESNGSMSDAALQMNFTADNNLSAIMAQQKVDYSSVHVQNDIADAATPEVVEIEQLPGLESSPHEQDYSNVISKSSPLPAEDIFDGLKPLEFLDDWLT